MSDMRLIVAGAGGRMGRTLIKAIADTKGVTVSGALEQRGLAADRAQARMSSRGSAGRTSSSPTTPRRCCATPTASSISPCRRRPSSWCQARGQGRHRACDRHHRAFRPPTKPRSREAAKKAVIVKSGNMSLGVNLLAALVKRVAKTLDDEFDIEIVEMHHNKKIDAPSGTALLLGRAAAEGRGIDLDQRSVRSRDGHTGARHAGDIGFATLARRHRGRRAQRDLRRPRRAHRTWRTAPRTA